MSRNSSQFHLVFRWRCTWCTSPASCTRRTGRPQIRRTSRKVSQFSDFSLRLVITVAWQGFSTWKHGPSRLNMYLIRYRAKWAPSWWWKNGSSLQKTLFYFFKCFEAINTIYHHICNHFESDLMCMLSQLYTFVMEIIFLDFYYFFKHYICSRKIWTVPNYVRHNLHFLLCLTATNKETYIKAYMPA